MTNNPHKILVIKSDYSELTNVETFVNQIFKEYKIPNKYFNNAYLCISEAVVNSIEHGNRNDKNKEVAIFADCKSQMLYVKIKDEGEGFDPEIIADPTKVENIKKESGRGIHIIKTLSKQLEYNKKESSIQFKIECK